MNRKKIIYTMMRYLVAGAMLLPLVIFGQKSKSNPYGLKLIADSAAYVSLVKSDSNQRMVDLASYVPGIKLDIRYATTNNFTNKKIYSEARAFARLAVARALKQVELELQAQGLGLKIYDAYRPYAFTLSFYETIKDTVFVAAPWKGSRHNRGCALDLTIVNLQTGQELEMPTPFDEFSERAKPNYSDLPKKAIVNRGFLIRTMQKYGFTVYPDEWWHFDFIGWDKYPLMDISFQNLDRCN